jgi:hypothetical protein
MVWVSAHSVVSALTGYKIMYPDTGADVYLGILIVALLGAVLNVATFLVRTFKNPRNILDDRKNRFLNQTEFLSQVAMFLAYAIFALIVKSGFEGVGGRDTVKCIVEIFLLMFSFYGVMQQMYYGILAIGEIAPEQQLEKVAQNP